MLVGSFQVSHYTTRPNGAVVDPEIRRRLDQAIQDARQALEGINVDGETLTAEERAIRAEETQYQKKFVRFSSSGDITRLNSFEASP